MDTGQQMGHPQNMIVGSKTWLALRFPTVQIGPQSFRIYGVWLVVGIPFVHTMSHLLLSEYFPWVPRRGGVAGGHSFAATAPGLSSSWILYAFYLGVSEKIFRVECLSILPHFARGIFFLGHRQERQMKADLISFNAAISACEKAGHWQGDPVIPHALEELHLDHPSTLLATATVWSHMESQWRKLFTYMHICERYP